MSDITRDAAWDVSGTDGLRGGAAGLRTAARAAVCAMLLLGLGEAVARGALTSPSRQVFDAELGFRYLPGTVFFDGSEGGARLRLNASGFNDDEVGPKGERPRVAVVGDSMTMAYQVDRARNYVARVQALRPDLEFVNLSQADMGPVQYQVLIERFAPALAPDRVVFAFSYGDVADVRKAPPSIERGPDGAIARLVPQPPERQAMKRWIEPLIQRSALATHMMRRFGPMLARWGGEEAAPPAREPSDAEVVEIIAFVLREAAARRVVAAMFVPQIEYRAGRQAGMDAGSARDAGIVARAADRAGVPLHVAEGALTQAYAASGQPGHGFANRRVGEGHLNAAGHEAVARGLAAFLPHDAGSEGR
jgi:hypothetical protein